MENVQRMKKETISMAKIKNVALGAATIELRTFTQQDLEKK